MFYFEIKPRRTGKTSRLINSLALQSCFNKVYKKYDCFLVIAPTRAMVYLIEERIQQEYPGIDLSEIVFENSGVYIKSLLRYKMKTQIYIDECFYTKLFIERFDLFNDRLDDLYLTSTVSSLEGARKTCEILERYKMNSSRC